MCGEYMETYAPTWMLMRFETLITAGNMQKLFALDEIRCTPIKYFTYIYLSFALKCDMSLLNLMFIYLHWIPSEMEIMPVYDCTQKGALI